MLYVIMITQIGLINKVKKEIKHKKVYKSNCINKEKYNYVGLPYIKGLSDEMSKF